MNRLINKNEELDEDGFQRLSLKKNQSNNSKSSNQYSSNNTNNEKRVLCRNFNTPEGCKFKERCKFIHEVKKKLVDESKPTRINFKTKSTLCKNYQNGNCKFGENCHFAHGVKELKKLYRENSENDSKSNIFYVRHGETPFNALLKEDKKQGLLHPKEEYLDCSISEESIKKTLNLNGKIDGLNIRYCFVSPLNRALETAYHALKNYKNKTNIKVIVLPLLSEHISGSQHNICIDIEKKKKKYNDSSDLKFDWTYFNSVTKKNQNPNLYFLDFIDNKTIIPNFEDIVEKLEKDYNLESISEFLLQYINVNQHPETFNGLNRRCKEFKRFLSKFVNDNKINPSVEQILVFTHSGVIKLSSSKVAFESDNVQFFPNDSIYPSCLDMVRIDIE